MALLKIYLDPQLSADRAALVELWCTATDALRRQKKGTTKRAVEKARVLSFFAEWVANTPDNGDEQS